MAKHIIEYYLMSVVGGLE